MNLHIPLRCAAAWLLCLFVSVAGAVEPDGPYLVRGASGWTALSVEVAGGEATARTQTLGEGDSFTVPAVGPWPSFQVRIRPPASPAPDRVKFAARWPLLVVADTHGEYEILAQQLRAQGVVDEALRWSFGRGHLVVLGDVFDRGAYQTEILWLLYQLEAEAARAGGGVHLVLGNHELLALRGDRRYLHPKYHDTTRLLGVDSYARLFAADTLLGEWLRTRPAMQVVNDQLCLHAGVSRALLDSGLTLAEINAGVRTLLEPEAPRTPADLGRAELLAGPLGPLWYRGYFPGQLDFPAATRDDVQRALETFGVKRILVGHTIVPAVTPLHDGKVIAVQVYPRRGADGVPVFESLSVRRGEYWRVPLGGPAARLDLAPRP